MKAKLIQKNPSEPKRPDFILLVASIVLVLFGLLMIYNASPVTSLRDFGDPTRLAGRQIVWAFFGLIGATIVYKIPYKFWEKTAPIIMLGSIIILLAVFIPALTLNTYGASRWIGIGTFFSIQPSEFVKLAYIIYLAAFLSKKVRFWPFVVLTGLLVGVLLLQRDLGTAIVIGFTGTMLYFLSGAPITHFLLLVPAGLLSGTVFIFSE